MQLKKTISLLGVVLTITPALLFSQIKNRSTSEVTITIIEEDTHQITPAMLCITGLKDNLPRVPPYAEEAQVLVMTDSIYYSGIDYKADKNWFGPVRKMSGLGNNLDRSYVYELRPSIAYWKEPVMYQTSGNFKVNFPPGKWKISIEHGNEYIPINEIISVDSGTKELSKTFVLKRWINLPFRGWYSGDVHVHHPTTKQSFKDYLLAYAKAEDLHLINILEQGNDHEIRGARQAGFGKKFRELKNNIWLVSGQEDPSSIFGHVIGLNIDQLVRDTGTYNYYDLVFEKLRLQPGAIVGFAHFSWNGCDLPRGFPWLVTTKQIDFVELLQFSKINTLDYYDYLNLGFRLTAAAGSDFPWGSTIGEVRTLAYTGNNFNADTWFAALKAGNTFVTNGPALFFKASGKMPGTEITTTKGNTIELKVKALSNKSIGVISHLSIYNNDGVIAEVKNPFHSDSISISFSHTLTKSQWIAAAVCCDNGAVAHTTPVYCIVDCQPTWDKEKAPGIIQKQLTAIDATEKEEKEKEKVDTGILTRLSDARIFYRKFLKEINGMQD